MGGSLGGSKSNQQTQAQQNVWGGQGPALTNMYNTAGNFANQQMGSKGMQNAQNNMASQANMATGAWGNQLAGGAGTGVSNNVNPALVNSLQQGMTGPSNQQKVFSSMMGGDPNKTFIEPMIEQNARDIGRNMNENILPAVNDSAIGAGQLGSSRNQVAQGIVGRGALEEASRAGINARAGAWDKDLGMKLGIAQQADQNQLATRDQALGLIGGQNQATSGALGQGQTMQGMQWNPQMAPWQVMNQYSNTIGAPTVLGSASSTANSKGVGGGGGVYG